MSIKICIFCGRDSKAVEFNREHVIPDCIHGSLFLDDYVCTKCNSTLGANVDFEILKIPEILDAMQILELKHDHDGILNRHYSISGKSKDIILNHGRVKDLQVKFPHQQLEDGSKVVPETHYFDALKKSVLRDTRLKKAGIPNGDISRSLQDLRKRYDEAERGEFIKAPELGVTLKKRQDKLKVKVKPREQANVHPLVAKIAYELLFLFGAEFFAYENIPIQSKLIELLDSLEDVEDIYIFRSEPMFHKPIPAHMVKIEFQSYATTVHVSFFGYVDYILIGPGMSESYREKLRTTLGLEHLHAIAFQQDIKDQLKTFWSVDLEGVATILKPVQSS